MSFSSVSLFRQLSIWLQRIRKWFYNHARPSQPTQHAVLSINFSKPMQKVVPLTPAQAYSALFCAQGSDLYKELHTAWKLWTSGDEATINSYQHLFPFKHKPNIPFITFQQVIFRDKVSTATEDELDVLQEYIDTCFQEDTNCNKYPWQALKTNDAQLDINLERQYIKK